MHVRSGVSMVGQAARRRRRGIGAYPDQPYYDPGRPSWLPYWIDTPTESLAKYGATNMAQATANAAGMAVSTAANTAGDAVASGVETAIDNLSLPGAGLVAGVGVTTLLLAGLGIAAAVMILRR